MLSTAAFNAFLKTLEEPPSYVIFILATTEKHKIIPTILSRCQIFDFKRIEVRDMAEHLQSIAQKESIQAEYDALELIAQKADGGLRDALSMFDMIATFSFEGGINYQTTLDNLHILDYDYYFRMTDALWKQQIGEVYIILDDILRRGFDGHNFIVGLAKHFRDLLVCKDPKTLKLLEVTEKVKGQYAEQAQIVSASFLLSAMNIAAQCDLQYKSSKQPRLHVELSLNKMAFLNSVLNWNTLNAPANAESEKKNLTPDTNIQPSSYKPAAIKSEVKENSAIQYQNGTVQTAKIPTKLEDLAVAAAEKPLEQNKPFDAEDVRAVFEFYKKVQKDYQAHKVLNRGAELLADFVLKFKIEQEELSLFQGFEADLLSNFRKRLANQAITFQVEIFKEEVIRRVYTNHDKFDYLAEKHPALLALQNALGLEIDN
jgi:DNA polymerase-3 subunit gamma/tau